MIARAARPIISPAIIDSHGKPGMAGSTIGVETEIIVELVVGVLTTVIVETDVLTTVVVSELVVVTDVVNGVEVVLTTDDVLVAELDVEFVVACCPTTGGVIGSRWKIPVSAFVPVLG